MRAGAPAAGILGSTISRGSIDVAGLVCRPCLDRGHTCYAHVSIDGVATCIFCEDGVPCAHDQESDRHRPRLSSFDAKTFHSEIVKVRKGAPVQTAAKANGAADPHPPAVRLCKCGCGEVVPADFRFSYLKGHMKARNNPHASKPRGPYKKKKRGRPEKLATVEQSIAANTAIAIERESTPPSACARISIQVSEAQLSDFLSKLPEFAGYTEHLAPLPIGLKQRLVNLYLASPAAVPE